MFDLERILFVKKHKKQTKTVQNNTYSYRYVCIVAKLH